MDNCHFEDAFPPMVGLYMRLFYSFNKLRSWFCISHVERKLTATDYKKGVNCNCFASMLGTAFFFMNRASKEGGGACLYNKRLTSTLNPLQPETCNCQS